MIEVRPNQVWEDVDKRRGRKLLVRSVMGTGTASIRGNEININFTPSAIFEVLGTGRTVRIALERLQRPTSNGYRLVEDAPPDA